MKGFIVVCLLFTLMALIRNVPSEARIQPETVVGVWLLDEGKGNTAKDLSGKGNDGALKNNPQWTKGKFGQALKFPGTVEVPDTPVLNFETDSFTVVTWFNFSAAQDWNRLVRERNPSPWGSGNAGWELQTQGVMVHWSLDDAGGNHKRNTYENVGDGKWHHTAMVVDRKNKQLITYLDGANEKNVPIAEIKSVTGVLPVIFGDGYNGMIDEIGIFNVVLSVDDINRIMTDGLEKAVGASPVEPSDKLPMTWAAIKAHN